MKRQTRSVALLVILILLIATPVFAESDYTLPGRFTFCYPEKWTVSERAIDKEPILWDASFTDEETNLRLFVYIEDLSHLDSLPVRSLYAAGGEQIEAFKDFIIGLQSADTQAEYLLTYTADASGANVPFIVFDYYTDRGRRYFACTAHEGEEICFLLYRTAGGGVMEEELTYLLDALGSYVPVG